MRGSRFAFAFVFRNLYTIIICQLCIGVRWVWVDGWPNSCGSSWQKTAMLVARPVCQSEVNDAPTARPSAKLWTASPIVTIHATELSPDTHHSCTAWSTPWNIQRDMTADGFTGSCFEALLSWKRQCWARCQAFDDKVGKKNNGSITWPTTPELVRLVISIRYGNEHFFVK